MAKIPEPFDRRIVQRNLENGLVSKADYEKYLAELPDVADNAEVVEVGPAEGAHGSGVKRD